MIKEYKGFQIRIDLITLSGSHLYGNSTPQSDVDYRGIFTILSEDKIGLMQYPTRISDPKWVEELSNEYQLGMLDFSDVELFELEDFIKLSMDNNPNIMDVLFTDDAATLYINAEGRKLINSREIFLSKKIKHTFSGYAMAQLNRIKGHNKWITRYPETDTVADFIKGAYNLGDIDKNWIADFFSGDLQKMVLDATDYERDPQRDILTYDEFKERILGYHPKLDIDHYKRKRFIDYTSCYDLTNTKIDMDTEFVDGVNSYPLSEILETRASFRKLNEHTVLIYTDGRGIFGREGKLKANDSEIIGEFICIAKIDVHNHKKDNDDIQKMWHWKVNRNKKRSALEEKFGYDTKHASHLARLMRGAINILTTGEYHPRLTGDDLQFVKDVRAGKYTYDWILNYATEMDLKLNDVMNESTLQYKVDREKINVLYKDLSFKEL